MLAAVVYDFATGISFMETHPQVPNLRAAWLDGYRHVRAVSIEDEEEIDSFIMLTGMAAIGLDWLAQRNISHVTNLRTFALGSMVAREYLDKCRCRCLTWIK